MLARPFFAQCYIIQAFYTAVRTTTCQPTPCAWKEAAWGCLLTTGAGRALSTHSLDYQNHVGEYGVHWNFFLTLAALRLANIVLAHIARSAPASGGLLSSWQACWV